MSLAQESEKSITIDDMDVTLTPVKPLSGGDVRGDVESPIPADVSVDDTCADATNLREATGWAP